MTLLWSTRRFPAHHMRSHRFASSGALAKKPAADERRRVALCLEVLILALGLGLAGCRFFFLVGRGLTAPELDSITPDTAAANSTITLVLRGQHLKDPPPGGSGI